MRDHNRQETIWQFSQSQPTLEEGQVHIWRASLDLPTVVIDQLATFLSPDEIERANKFRFAQHKRRFIAARGILRELLSNYLQISPNDLKFKYGDRGKPELTGCKQDTPLKFNLSHSGEYVLYGFTYHHSIGVDLEHIREMPDAVKIAQRFFSDREYRLINSVEDTQKSAVFFKLWTAKEAYLKAIGIGLSGSLANVDITFDCVQSPRLLAISGSKTAVTSWSIYSCIPATSYIATIAVKTLIPFKQINFWHWHQSCSSITPD